MKTIKRYTPYLILLLCGITLLVRALYGFCWSDESFYASTAYRFMCGDRVFHDDWFPTQLSGIITIPFLYFYNVVVGSMSGVLLYLRIIYVLLSVICSGVLFYIFSRDRNLFIAYTVSLLMLFYTHLNIATLSYYTISVQCFMLSMALIYHFMHTGMKSNLVGSGVLFAFSVLALPTMSVVYVVLIMGIIIAWVISSKTKNHNLRDRLERLQIGTVAVYTLAGIAIPAVLFCIFMIGNVSLSDFIKGIPYVLSDEEHGTSLIFPLRKFFISINAEFHKGAYLSYLMILASLLGRKLLMKKPVLKQLAFMANTGIFFINAIYAMGHTGYIMTALCLFALPLYILTESRDRKLFYTIFVGGMIFSLVYSYSSNGFLYVLSMGHAVASAASIAFIYDFWSEIQGELDIANKKTVGALIKGISIMIICYCLCTTVYLRMVNVYRDAPLSKLDAVVTQGPAKGLRTTQQHKNLYDTVYDVIRGKCTREALGMQEGDEGYLFITKLLPFGYMCTDLRVAAPSTWRTSFDSERLREYYELNPEKLPDVVLVLDEEYGTYDTCGDVEYDPSPNANEIGGFLAEYLETEGYSRENVACGVVYRR